jgi:hypothetical protein
MPNIVMHQTIGQWVRVADQQIRCLSRNGCANRENAARLCLSFERVRR